MFDNYWFDNFEEEDYCFGEETAATVAVVGKYGLFIADENIDEVNDLEDLLGETTVLTFSWSSFAEIFHESTIGLRFSFITVAKWGRSRIIRLKTHPLGSRNVLNTFPVKISQILISPFVEPLIKMFS